MPRAVHPTRFAEVGRSLALTDADERYVDAV
jgi:hypothetical protein